MNSPGDNAADPYSARILIKRLLTEYATQHIRLYVLAGVMMMVGAACMAASAYLIGDMINQAYVNRNFPAILEGRRDLRAGRADVAHRDPHRR
jgi:hypothetical protein